jgi:hypothetical protein
MPEQKQQGVKRLVLRRGSDMTLNSEIGEVCLDISRRQRLRWFILQETLKLARPVRIGF